MDLTVRGTALVGAVLGLLICAGAAGMIVLVATGVLKAGLGPDYAVSPRPDPSGVYLVDGGGFLLGLIIAAAALRTVVALRGKPFREAGAS